MTRAPAPLPRRMEPLALARCSDSPLAGNTVAGQRRDLTGLPLELEHVDEVVC